METSSPFHEFNGVSIEVPAIFARLMPGPMSEFYCARLSEIHVLHTRPTYGGFVDCKSYHILSERTRNCIAITGVQVPMSSHLLQQMNPARRTPRGECQAALF